MISTVETRERQTGRSPSRQPNRVWLCLRFTVPVKFACKTVHHPTKLRPTCRHSEPISGPECSLPKGLPCQLTWQRQELWTFKRHHHHHNHYYRITIILPFNAYTVSSTSRTLTPAASLLHLSSPFWAPPASFSHYRSKCCLDPVHYHLMPPSGKGAYLLHILNESNKAELLLLSNPPSGGHSLLVLVNGRVASEGVNTTSSSFFYFFLLPVVTI